jgi:leader peptidase (prepilin peptidase) / N-methyltransferase
MMMPVAMVVVMATVLGAMCGSFAAAVADRVPRGESVVSGRSRCRGCAHTIAVHDLVPVVSWLALRGRCRWCGVSIGPTSFVIELLTAVVFVGCALRIERPVALLAHLILVTGLMSLSVIDVFTLRLPRRIVHMTGMLGAPVLFADSVMSGETGRLVAALVGATLAFVTMLIVHLVSRGKLGDGDVRLSPLLGLYLGWKDLSAVHSGFFLAFLLGSIIGLVLICSTRSARSRVIPFGPFLASGTMLALLFDIDFLS